MAFQAAEQFKLFFTSGKSNVSRIQKQRANIFASDDEEGRKKASRIACPAYIEHWQNEYLT